MLNSRKHKSQSGSGSGSRSLRFSGRGLWLWLWSCSGSMGSILRQKRSVSGSEYQSVSLLSYKDIGD